MLQQVEFYYFSPTGGTRKAGEIFCRAIARQLREVDLGKEMHPTASQKADLSVMAVPVFGGRVPAAAVERIRELNGEGKRAVTLAVYGNRAYEDALLEVNDAVEECGFQIAASAALIAQHSIVTFVAENRPDEADAREIREFAQEVEKKLQMEQTEKIQVPGSRPYKDGMKGGSTPMTLDTCTKCGRCVSVCPVGAIDKNSGGITTDAGKCILCMACTVKCPEHARILPPPMKAVMDEKLGVLKDIRKENEFFL